ncbi:MAG TPA: hypothetical protein DEP53_02915 [Bacteroidetes bacterium]|nr:hypothetical protein [Bacteroidota bacterium]
MTLKRSISHLSPGDLVSILFLFLITALNLVFHARVEQWLTLVIVNIAVIALVALLAWGAETKKNRLLTGLHRWYCYFIILFIFKEIYLMIRPIHPVDYDQLFISIDRMMFGVNPTEWMAQFANPILTEILQVAYFSYYILFIVLGVELYRRYTIDDFDKAAFLIVYGFYLSYLGYFALPGVGPRFTLHNFSLIGLELPGIFLTDYLRAIINAGESIPQSHPNPIEVVQRDVFPSGHTQLTIIVMTLGFRHRLKARWFLLSCGSLLVVATVYLRYHYVIDLIAGALLAWFTIWSGDRLEVWWRDKTNRLRGETLT